MSLTWSALPIAPNGDFNGAPLLRTEFVLEVDVIADGQVVLKDCTLEAQ